MAYAKLVQRVIAANAAIERAERDHNGTLPATSDYFQLCADANTGGTTFRRLLAELLYLVGDALRGSRLHDNCFENGDGDQVVAHLVERSRSDPRLEAAIARDFGGTFPAQWLETAAKVTRAQGELELVHG